LPEVTAITARHRRKASTPLILLFFFIVGQKHMCPLNKWIGGYKTRCYEDGEVVALVWTTNKQILNLEFVKRLEKNITFVVTRISG